MNEENEQNQLNKKENTIETSDECGSVSSVLHISRFMR